MNLFKNLFSQNSSQQVDEKTIIAEIHNAFDTAEDRLLQEAQSILNDLKITPQLELEEKANRLHKIGFVNSPIVKKADSIKEERKEIQGQIVKTKSEAELIQYYKLNYPFLKFLTEKELVRICKKYNLVYAPVENFIKDVPDKNLKEIENAQLLKREDVSETFLTVSVREFWESCPREIRNIFKKEVSYHGYVCGNNNEPYEKDLLKIATQLGYKGDYKGYIFRKATVKKVNREGLFICAPPSHFDLSKLSNEEELGYFKVQTWEINDPIVYRYCRGGVQVLSKWGLESGDESLVNEINN